jgi:hypothetical protein
MLYPTELWAHIGEAQYNKYGKVLARAANTGTIAAQMQGIRQA